MSYFHLESKPTMPLVALKKVSMKIAFFALVNMGSRVQVICVPLEIDIKRKIVFSAVSIDRILMSTREPNHRNTML